jgi:hypothetical protein
VEQGRRAADEDSLDGSARDSRLAAGFRFDWQFPGRSVGGNIYRGVDPIVELGRLLPERLEPKEWNFAQTLVEARSNLDFGGSADVHVSRN